MGLDVQSFTSAKIYERTCGRGQKGIGVLTRVFDPLKRREIKGRLDTSILDCSATQPGRVLEPKSPSEESGVLTSLPN